MAWPAAFEAAIRRNLTDLGSEVVLEPDAPLVAFGLDSMGMVALVFDVESALGVVLPDEALLPETFATAGSLWAAVESALAVQHASRD